LARGGSATVTVTATVKGTPTTVTAPVKIHALDYKWQVVFPGIPMVAAATSPARLGLGAHNPANDLELFRVEGTVALAGSCNGPDCAWQHLRLGFAQSVTSNLRHANYSAGAKQDRLPGHQPDNTLNPPVRDCVNAAHYFSGDHESATFASKAAPATATLSDYPGVSAEWNDPPLGTLQFLRLRESFTTWLVLCHEKWRRLFGTGAAGAAAARYVCHFTWSVDGTVWVANAAAHTIEEALVGKVTHSEPVVGMGGQPATFHGPIANALGHFVQVPRIDERSPLQQFY
jgi:hypothetical protein